MKEGTGFGPRYVATDTTAAIVQKALFTIPCRLSTTTPLSSGDMSEKYAVLIQTTTDLCAGIPMHAMHLSIPITLFTPTCETNGSDLNLVPRAATVRGAPELQWKRMYDTRLAPVLM